MIELGNKVKDIVTGYEGIAVSRIEYLNGCVQYCVKPKVGKDGKIAEGEFIDQEQLKDLGKAVKVVAKPTGGNMSDTPSGFGLSRS